MRRLSILLGLFWSLSASAGVSDWIPFQLERGHIAIPVVLNGERTTAILDSGASGNGISEAFLARHAGEYGLGRAMNVRGIYGERRVRLVDDIQAEMFGYNFKIGQLMPMRTNSFDFLVGLPFFENYIVQIDYPNARLRLFDHDSLKLRKVANVKMKRSRSTSHPLVRVSLNDEYKLWVTFDTGASMGLLIKRFDAERFDWLEKYGTDEGRSVGVNGVIADVERFNLPRLDIGPFTLENAAVTVPAAGQETNIASGARHGRQRELNNYNSDGLLGYEVLKHFIVTIDFKRSLLHLELPEDTSISAAMP